MRWSPYILKVQVHFLPSPASGTIPLHDFKRMEVQYRPCRSGTLYQGTATALKHHGLLTLVLTARMARMGIGSRVLQSTAAGQFFTYYCNYLPYVHRYRMYVDDVP